MGGRKGRERWCESAIRPEEPKRSQGGVGGYLGVANLVTKGEEGVEVKGKSRNKI